MSQSLRGPRKCNNPRDTTGNATIIERTRNAAPGSFTIIDTRWVSKTAAFAVHMRYLVLSEEPTDALGGIATFYLMCFHTQSVKYFKRT